MTEIFAQFNPLGRAACFASVTDASIGTISLLVSDTLFAGFLLAGAVAR